MNSKKNKANKDNIFILDLQKSDIRLSFKHKVLYYLIKLLNPKLKNIKLKFRDDNLNRIFGIKYSRLDSHENLLEGNMINIEQAMNIYHLLTRTLMLNIPGDIVFDVGAYKGDSAIFFADKLNRQGIIYAFEPIEANFAGLKKNIEANSLEGIVIPVKKALSDRSGTISGFTPLRGAPWAV